MPKMMMRRTKIICTIGPESRSRTVIRSLIRSGMNVARLNFSHGTHRRHAAAIRLIRELSLSLGKPVAILLDLQGPKIRVGTLSDGRRVVRSGDRVVLRASRGRGTQDFIPVDYRFLAKDVSRGSRILIDDGMIELRVAGTRGKDVWCRVVTGGTIRDNKGINLPGVPLRIPSLTAKDRRDVAFGMRYGVDYIALSFVRKAADLRALKRLVRRSGTRTPVIAKLEKPEAIEDLDAILDEADGVMVARGDLGVEVSPERVPMIQKMVIERANRRRVLVITATQMLDSMMRNPQPTRAEASDVANAVFDGTDALMLSGETAVGRYPVQSLRMMGRIVEAAETSLRRWGRDQRRIRTESEGLDFPIAISDAATHSSYEIDARAIAAFTQSGFTPLMISKFRPQVPIIAFTPGQRMVRRMALYWGVVPIQLGKIANTDMLILAVEKALLRDRLIRRGDAIVFLSSAPLFRRDTTNLMKLHRVR
jgi:pyruvate kinase